MAIVAEINRAAARGTFFALILRLLSFGCTQLTFRALDPSSLGTNSKLELILTTILFISREGFRLALTQNVIAENRTVAWLTIPVVTIISMLTLIWHISSTLDNNTDYRVAGVLYCLASWIEGCAEPAVLFFLRKLEVPPRVEGEMFASIGKTCATAIGLRLLSTDWSVTVFGIGQMVYAITFSLYLYARAWSRPDWKKIGLPPLSFQVFWKQLDQSTCYKALVYTVQGVFKHLLTEADKIVLTSIADSYDQGVYAMGSAYGGIAARILLQPLEENARLLWSRLAINIRKRQEDQQQLLRSYTVLVKLVLYIGLVFSCIAIHYTNLLLNILAGPKWGSNGEAADVLAAFCVYTAFLALNGMTEAFVYAVGGGDSTAAEMTKLGFAHSFVGLTFAAAAFVLVGRYGTLGLVAANCVAMLVRSSYSFYFATRYFGEIDAYPSSGKKYGKMALLSEIIPHPMVLTGFIVAWLGTLLSLQNLVEKKIHLKLDIRNIDWLLQTGMHIATALVFIIGITFLVIRYEKIFVGSLNEMFLNRRNKQQRPKND